MITFAVVGHPNKGKSSIVATLAENERVAISAVPGTTKDARAFGFQVDGETLYELVDTPGFQRANQVWAWMQSHAADASSRAAVVQAFVDAHGDDERFHDECELLRPILAGAGMLYVVDGAKPYGPEFEVEMQILQWTGRPRMALINLIGSTDYVDQWRRALGQYFSIVRVFDAMHADFTARVNLLGAFAELDEAWRGSVQRSIDALYAERERRVHRSAASVSQALIDCLTYTQSTALGEHEDAKVKTERLQEQLMARVKRREQRARNEVQAHYHHEQLQRSELGLPLLDADLFTSEGWELFGLSKSQLLISGAMSGALAGLGIDALVGGASLLLGAGIGAVVGGVGSYFGGDEIAKAKVLGASLGGRQLRVGPIHAANFPWVFVGRAWVHHQLVQERNHALRDALSTQLEDSRNLMDQIPDEQRQELLKVFKKINQEGRSKGLEASLTSQLKTLFSAPPNAGS